VESQEHYAKAKWAKILEVSTTGYYTWLKERDSRRERHEAIRNKVLDLFWKEGKGTYGIDRICGCMRRDGMSASYNTVKRVFDEEGLKSVHCRRRQRSLTDSRKSRGEELQNLTKDLEINKPFQVLSSDISYIRTEEGFDYLCQVRDVHTNTVLAESHSSRMKKDLVLKTVERTMNRWNLPEDVIFHSDRGSQYTAKEVVSKIDGYGWKQSFSRVGKPGDNAWSESFFAILKKEIVHWRVYKTREEARKAIFEYIEVFYNRQRAQKRLGYLSPIQYLDKYLEQHYASVA